MKDLEDLLPNKSLIPAPTEEEKQPSPGTHTPTHTCTHTHTHISHLLSLTAPPAISDVAKERGNKSPKVKPGAAAKGVSLQKDVSLAAPNPRAPVTRAPGPRRGPPGAVTGKGRGRDGPSR